MTRSFDPELTRENPVDLSPDIEADAEAVELELRAFQNATVDNTDGVLKLLEYGVSPNARDAQGQTLLCAAVRRGNRALAQHLLDFGANPDRRCRDNTAPLDAAIMMEDLAMMEVLFLGGANLDTSDVMGMTPLMLAAARNLVGVVQFLLRCGADPQIKARDGKSALHCALASDARECAKLLAPNYAER